MRSQFYTFHTSIVLSQYPEARYSPLGENTTLKTLSECPLRVFMCSPFHTLHTLIVLSRDPEARYSPLGEKDTLWTE